MKVVHILGRGVEGCGVTRFTLEMKNWAIKQGWEYTIYAPTDKKWTRGSAHELDQNVKQWRWGKPSRNSTQHGVDLIIEDANKADLVIFGSIPSKSHPQECIDAFDKLLNAITTQKVMIQHDHNMLSIRRNANLEQTTRKMDVIFCLSSKNPFAQYCKSINATETLFSFCNGIDMDLIRDRFWKNDIAEQDPRHLKWIGRSTFWKGLDILFDFYEGYTKGLPLLITLEGLEKSIQFVNIREMYDFHEMDLPIDEVPLEYGVKPYVFGPYNNSEMLERMSKCGFGFQLTRLNPEYIENFVEYTHLEVVAAGAIPIFRKSYGTYCHHPITGNPLIEDKDTGTLWAEEPNADHSALRKSISKLIADPVMRNEYRNAAYEYYSSHSKADISFPVFFEKAKTKKKEAVDITSFFG